jgi:hypothetical protein
VPLIPCSIFAIRELRIKCLVNSRNHDSWVTHLSRPRGVPTRAGVPSRGWGSASLRSVLYLPRRGPRRPGCGAPSPRRPRRSAPGGSPAASWPAVSTEAVRPTRRFASGVLEVARRPLDEHLDRSLVGELARVLRLALRQAQVFRGASSSCVGRRRGRRGTSPRARHDRLAAAHGAPPRRAGRLQLDVRHRPQPHTGRLIGQANRVPECAAR